MASPEIVLRQRGSVLAGWVGMLVFGGLLVGLLMSGSLGSSLSVALVLLLLLALTWVLMVRPAVALGPDAVVLHNPFRDTSLPWGLIESTGTRWMLEVHTAQRHYASWAIGSSPTRPSLRVIPGPRSAEVERTPGVTAASAAQLIDECREAYAAAQHGDPQTPAVQTEWSRPAVMLVGLPAVLLALRLVF